MHAALADLFSCQARGQLCPPVEATYSLRDYRVAVSRVEAQAKPRLALRRGCHESARMALSPAQANRNFIEAAARRRGIAKPTCLHYIFRGKMQRAYKIKFTSIGDCHGSTCERPERSYFENR